MVCTFLDRKQQLLGYGAEGQGPGSPPQPHAHLWEGSASMSPLQVWPLQVDLPAGGRPCRIEAARSGLGPSTSPSIPPTPGSGHLRKTTETHILQEELPHHPSSLVTQNCPAYRGRHCPPREGAGWEEGYRVRGEHALIIKAIMLPITFFLIKSCRIVSGTGGKVINSKAFCAKLNPISYWQWQCSHWPTSRPKGRGCWAPQGRGDSPMPSFSCNSPPRQVVSGPAACTAEGHWGTRCGLLIVIRISPRQSSLQKAGGGGGETVGGGRASLYCRARDMHFPTLGSWQQTAGGGASHRYFLKESPICCFICCRPW